MCQLVGVVRLQTSHVILCDFERTAGSLLPQYTRVHACMLESNPGQSSASVLSLSSVVLVTAAAAMTAHARLARGQVVSPEPKSSGCIYTVQLFYHLRGSTRGYNYNTHLFGS